MLQNHAEIQSPPKESIHFCRAEYSKLRGARWKVGGAPNQPLSWSKPVSPSFGISKWGLVQFGPTLAPLNFEYLALPQVNTFFRWRLYTPLARFPRYLCCWAIFQKYVWPFLTKWPKISKEKNIWKINWGLFIQIFKWPSSSRVIEGNMQAGGYLFCMIFKHKCLVTLSASSFFIVFTFLHVFIMSVKEILFK